MLDERVRLLKKEEVARDFFLARFRAPEIAAEAIPGQFVEIRVNAGEIPFLRLPLSICAVDREVGSIDLLFEAVGAKTEALKRMEIGNETACLGPLGRGFQVPPLGRTGLLVGGGIGIPPLLFWGEVLRAQGYRTILLAGARTADKHLPDSLLMADSQKVRRATDDGSMGHSGLVTDLLTEELEGEDEYAVFTCGPHGMMAAVAALCAACGVACQVSLEEYMACGIGICVGCVVEVIPEEGESDYGRYRRVCVDGPVFDARQVRWERG
jgi:dihydroorotate dehydrogenase electron transfer subunit